MDEIAKYNSERWQALVQADAVFTRPYLDLDAASARQYLDANGKLGQISGQRVLCLASGGGQQSAAFALLGATVTVLDLSPAQLDKDAQAARHYDVEIETLQGDMRDLSRFAAASFDIVWHPYSLNFVPDAGAVFGQVARVLRPKGIYHFMCANPFTWGMQAKDWNGQAYPLRHPYIDGAEMIFEDESWVLGPNESHAPIKPIKEYRHTLSKLINDFAQHGFVIFSAEEHTGDNGEAPGSWEHFKSIAPPYLSFWTSYRPDVLRETNVIS